MTAFDIAPVGSIELKHGKDKSHQDFTNDENGRPQVFVFWCGTFMNDWVSQLH